MKVFENQIQKKPSIALPRIHKHRQSDKVRFTLPLPDHASRHVFNIVSYVGCFPTIGEWNRLFNPGFDIQI